MSLSQKTLRRGAATGAVVLAFGAMAPAFADGAGLINDSAALNRYTPALSKTMAAVTGDDLARGRAGGFMVDLETTLKAPADRPRIVDYPKPASANQLRITAVAPPMGFEHMPIPVCAEKDSKVLGTWNITPKGEVVPVRWTGNNVVVGTSPACKDFITAARSKFLPPVDPAQPPPLQAEQKAISKPSASLATATPNG
jgi:hypothetical protein